MAFSDSQLDDASARLSAAGVMVERGVPLSSCGTFRLGGPCRLLARCASEESLVAAVRALRGLDVPRVVIGGGSNILFSDRGFPGVVLRFWSDDAEGGIAHEGDDLLAVSGAVALDRLAEHATEAGLGGLSSLSGIPGSVGGAVAGNAGAWGEQIGDVVERARLLDAEGTVREVSGAELGFAYRRSRLQASGEIVLRVWVRVRPGDAAALRERRREILALRAEKHPRPAEHPSIGSIFRNVEPTSAAGRRQAAGWFLEQAGAKDFAVGGARLFPRHANIIVKGDDSCRAQDVRDLTVRMREAVRETFGLELAREVRFLGDFAGEEGRAGFF
jgi:UDP-N-acetylmuramate dehydrogenase